MIEDKLETDYVSLTASIVSAYLGNNTLDVNSIPELITLIYQALKQIEHGCPPQTTQAQPAVPIKKSVTSDYLICLEDGRMFKSLKRHLKAKYGLSPEQYRKKWGLPADYPMVAPNYAKARSNLAKAIGLGQPRNDQFTEAY